MDEFIFSDKLFGDKLIIKLFDIDCDMANIVTKDAYEEALRLQHIFNIYDKKYVHSLN